jgi:putative ATP-dependent endonuclease of the OLD family
MAEGKLLRGNATGNVFPQPIKDFLAQELPKVSPSNRITTEQAKELFDRTHKAGLVTYQEGWRSLDPHVMSSLVQVVMLSADVRVEEEIQDNRSSILTKVGGQLLRDATESDPDIKNALDALAAQIERVSKKSDDGTWPIPKLNRFEEILEEEIHRFDKGVHSESQVYPPRVPTVDFSIGVDVGDDCVDSLVQMGHGLRRSVVFAMLRTHRRLKQEFENPEDGRQSPLYLFLIEEPELYLHPQAERRRMAELKELSQDDDAQVVLCTHSAIFVDLNEYKGIHRLERPGRLATRVTSWTGPDPGADVADTVSLIWRTNVYRSAMVFADLVILVEGASEQAAIPHIARKLELTKPDVEVEVVSCDGNANIPPIQTILEGLGIKYVAWLDNKSASDRREVAKAKANKKGFGVVVTTDQNWEKMNGLSGSDNKIYKSWKYFIQEDREPNEKLKARMTAAYSWEDYEG